jgi:hypothetical protein
MARSEYKANGGKRQASSSSACEFIGRLTFEIRQIKRRGRKGSQGKREEINSEGARFKISDLEFQI